MDNGACDGAAFLTERCGDVAGALKLLTEGMSAYLDAIRSFYDKHLGAMFALDCGDYLVMTVIQVQLSWMRTLLARKSKCLRVCCKYVFCRLPCRMCLLAVQLLRSAMSLCSRQHKIIDDEGMKRMWFSVLDVFLVPQRLLKEQGSRYSSPPFPIVKMAQCIFQST